MIRKRFLQNIKEYFNKLLKKAKTEEAHSTQTLVDFFQKSPLFGLNLKFKRDKSVNRDIEL